jgi:hypothetical protein
MFVRISKKFIYNRKDTIVTKVTEDTTIEFVGREPVRNMYRHFKVDDDNYANLRAYATRHGISLNEAIGRLLVIADNSGDFPKEKKRRYY